MQAQQCKPLAAVNTDGTRPAWSVMIPVYRPDETFLREALESVLRQASDRDSMQIAVVDDASEGVDVPRMVRQIAGTRVDVHRNSRNLGLAGCWNECVRNARGRWVHILHQDDLVLPGFYDALGPAFSGQSIAGAAFCRHAIFDENGHWLTLSALEQPMSGMLPDWLPRITSGNYMQCPSVVVRRSVYEELGLFRTDLPHALDWEMWIRIANQYPIYFEPRILACYRQHTLTATTRQQQSGETVTDSFKAIAIWSKYLSDPRTVDFARAARRQYAEGGLRLARRFAYERNFAAARHNLKAVLAQYPCFTLRWSVVRILLRMALLGRQSTQKG